MLLRGSIFRAAVAATLFSLLMCVTDQSSADSTEQGILPLPAQIFSNIFPEGSQGNVDVKSLLDEGIIEKWKSDLKIYFAHESDSETAAINNLIKVQLKPLMLASSQTTGLGFKRVYSLSEANVVFIFAEKPSDASRFVGLGELKTWFAARNDQEFNVVEAAVREPQALCFRFINTPEHEITKAIGFVSIALDQSHQEKCLARNLLYGLGLKGTTDLPTSAKSPETSSRALGRIDEMALDILYRDGVEPGMSLGEALGK